MRVISGKARGVVLKTPNGDLTRPTADRVKEAMFSIIQFDLPGATVLDLFGGTGQLGIEALSRGATSAVFVDAREDACRLIRENLKRTKLEQNAKVLRSDYLDYLKRSTEKFNIILFTPHSNLIIISCFFKDGFNILNHISVLNACVLTSKFHMFLFGWFFFK